MSTFELPAEYKGWLETSRSDYERRADAVAVTLSVAYWDEEKKVPGVKAVRTVYLVPPKPKPTLPNVGVGGVVGFHTKRGLEGSRPDRDMRAVRHWDGSWAVFTSGGLLGADRHLSSYLLEMVDDDGFTVECEGL